MERHNGSKEKGWSEKGCEERRTQGREEGRTQGCEKESHSQAPLALMLFKKKAGFVPAFLFSSTGNDQREYRALASSTILLINAGYSIPSFNAAVANSLFASR